MAPLQKDVAVPENKQKCNFSIVLHTGKKYISAFVVNIVKVQVCMS